MFRHSLLVSSSALNIPPAFTTSALQLLKIQLTHKNAVKEKEMDIARDLEEQFHDELHSFRPVFTQAGMSPAVRGYNPRLLRAMRYFGLVDDPITTQLERLVGKQSAARQPDTQMFKTGGRATKQVHWSTLINSSREEQPFELPTELPFPASRETPVFQDRKTVKVHDEDRGHWVLREEGIAISKDERRRDPW